MEMLENAIKKYHNKVLTAAEVMDELIKLSKEIISMDDEASELDLTELIVQSIEAFCLTRSVKTTANSLNLSCCISSFALLLLETTIRQVIDQALVSEQVIDVFDAAGIKKPDISILSEELFFTVFQAQNMIFRR
jgi:type I restriction enzyme R subunit